MNSDITPAAVTQSELDKIQNLEKEIGKVVLAVEPEPTYAKLNREQIDRLRQIEQEMGVVMVAFRSD